MAHLQAVPRQQTFWARRNPFQYVEGALSGLRTKRSSGVKQSTIPPASALHQKHGSAILRRGGYTSGLGPGGVERRKPRRGAARSAWRQAAKIGLIAGAAAIPAGYLGLRTRLGQRLANKLILKARPLKALRSFVGYSQGHAINRAEAVVGTAERFTRRKLFGVIDRATAKLTGVNDLPTELLYQQRQLKTRLLGSPRQLHARYGKELQAIERQIAESPTKPGLLDRADAIFKRSAGRLARRFGIPVTGPMSKGAVKEGANFGFDRAKLAQRKQIEKLYKQVRRRGRAWLPGVTLTKLKGGAIRRRGRLNESVFFPTSHRPEVRTPHVLSKIPQAVRNLDEIAARNAKRLAAVNIETMSHAELRNLLHRQPGMPEHMKRRIRARLLHGK
jgi:hypothetical protein